MCKEQTEQRAPKVAEAQHSRKQPDSRFQNCFQKGMCCLPCASLWVCQRLPYKADNHAVSTRAAG